MHPTGFYDLPDARPQPIPVVSTSFRPTDTEELARNPFRVFTSVLVPQDRRFFDADLERRLTAFIESRTLFPEELLALADRAETGGGLDAADAERFLELATSFALSPEPVDRAWYAELERISGVAADFGGVASTHINHLTPRVLDIDDLHRRMQDRGITMIDRIQGRPPGAARTCCSGRRRSGRWPSRAGSPSPTAACPPGSCGCASARSRRAGSRSPRPAETSTTGWSPWWTSG